MTLRKNDGRLLEVTVRKMTSKKSFQKLVEKVFVLLYLAPLGAVILALISLPFIRTEVLKEEIPTSLATEPIQEDLSGIINPEIVLNYEIGGTEANGEHFGISSNLAGDVNGDGFQDLIVGSSYSIKTGNGGTASVFYGQKGGFDKTSAWTYPGDLPLGWLGKSVASAGDVNGDGFDDVIVGWPGWEWDEYGEYWPFADYGAALLFYGSKNGLSQRPGWIVYYDEARSPWVTNPALAKFGWAVSGVGDVNHDGYDDFAVGAPDWNDPSDNKVRGAIFVFYGSARGPSREPNWQTRGFIDWGRLGFSFARLGDVNQDGYEDFASGAPNYVSGSYPNSVMILFGGENGFDTEATQLITNPDWWDFGNEITALDANGDGLQDLLVGTKRRTAWGEGAVSLYLGNGQGFSSQPDWEKIGTQRHEHFGHSLANLGDINRDGCDDFAVGAPYYDPDPSDSISYGRIQVYLGNKDLAIREPFWEEVGHAKQRSFGFSLIPLQEAGQCRNLLFGATSPMPLTNSRIFFYEDLSRDVYCP